MGIRFPRPKGTWRSRSWTTSCRADIPLRIARVRDQSTEFLRLAEEKGLTLGSLVTVRERSEATDTVDLELARGNGLSLGFRAAEKFLVESV